MQVAVFRRISGAFIFSVPDSRFELENYRGNAVYFRSKTNGGLTEQKVLEIERREAYDR